MTKHTPGPWEASHVFIENKPNRTIITQREWGGRTIADLGETSAVNPANAALIAASPNLLAACKEAREILKTASQYFPKSIKNPDRFSLLNTLANTIEPAIKKAEGN